MNIKKIILTGALVATCNLLASTPSLTEIDKSVLKFEKSKLLQNKNITLLGVKPTLIKELPNNWKGYIFEISFMHDGTKKQAKDIVFSNGSEISSSVMSLKDGVEFKRLMMPTLDEKYYNEEDIIAGNKNAKHKMVIFSDPLCPICTRAVPGIIEKINANPKNVALYYIKMPLQMHPTATTLVRASMLAKEKGIKDIDYKVYTANFEKDFDAYAERDQQKVLDIFNKKFGTKFTMEEITTEKLNEAEKRHMKLSLDAMVTGTPTIYFDNEIDPTRSLFLKYIK